MKRDTTVTVRMGYDGKMPCILVDEIIFSDKEDSSD